MTLFFPFFLPPSPPSFPPRQFGSSEKNYQDEVEEGGEGGKEGGEVFTRPPLPPLVGSGTFPIDIGEGKSERKREGGENISTQQQKVVMPKQPGVEQHQEYMQKAVFPLPLPPSLPPPPPGLVHSSLSTTLDSSLPFSPPVLISSLFTLILWPAGGLVVFTAQKERGREGGRERG